MPTHIGRRHVHLTETDSTNSRAAEFANDPANSGTVVTADVQTRGRGQYGRTWQSPPGANVLLSTLLFPPTELRRPAILTAFAAVAVADVVEHVGETAAIKWPNDVLVRGKKVCGILSEAGVRSTEHGPHFVVGIGLNVNLSAEDFTRMELPDATSLSILAGRPLDVAVVTRDLIDTLDAEYGRLLAGDLDGLAGRWAAGLGRLGEIVTAERMDRTTVRGRLTEVTFAGLVVGGTRLVPEEVRHLI